MNDYHLLITQKAFSDISECVLFVANVSKEAAHDLYKEIVDRINSLKSFPNAFPEVEGLSIGEAKVRRMPVHKGRYFILYKVTSNLVTIYDIIDSRKDSTILKV